MNDELDKLKKLQNATVHMEFKPDVSAPRFYNLFSVSSDTKVNEYFTMAILDNTAIVEVVMQMEINSMVIIKLLL